MRQRLPLRHVRHDARAEGIRAVLADPAYRKEYSRDSLLPAFMPAGEAGNFTTRFAGELGSSLRELGLVKQ